MEINFLLLDFPAFSFNLQSITPTFNITVLLSLFLNYLDFSFHCYCHLHISPAWTSQVWYLALCSILLLTPLCDQITEQIRMNTTALLPLTQTVTTCFLCSYLSHVFLLLTQLITSSIMYVPLLSVLFSISNFSLMEHND